ncbi:MAG TPA: peptide chain release factor 1 [Spirochaetota bacterium]|nr:peptide chain release factor 1 [Spirochaetota bacterium]HOL57223.1 peptide chain release factor 1 [Spirochaetota bacterium]HPP04858.1 peptide chain release factor 1 [Spirochaetota bacterium]
MNEDLIFDSKTEEKLENIVKKYNNISQELADPSIINDNKKFRDLSKEASQLEEIVVEYNNYKNFLKQYNDTEEIIKNEKDLELISLAKEEKEALVINLKKIKEKIKILLIPPDPLASRNIIMEIRAGTGGEEAALFCADLFKMYSRYCEMKNWKLEVMDYNQNELGGYKEIIFSISGKNVYENLRFESGGHRVQRIPITEASGRVHTSAVTVAVLPEVEEIDIEIKPEDIKIDVLRAGGAGGQHVNKTESAVRITHIPTGIVVKCQDDRSQHKNKATALKILRARLFDLEQTKKQNEIAEMRKGQIGSGDRSDKIRTYNFPQNRVTDHRINMTLYKLDRFMMGEMDELIEALKLNFLEERIKSQN